jgi:Fe2+ transport system protein B
MNTTQSFFRLDYGGKLEREIAYLLVFFEEIKFDTGRYPQRWLAIKLLEGDVEILARVQSMTDGGKVIEAAQQGAEKLKSMLGEDVDLLTADSRFNARLLTASLSLTALTTSSRTSGWGCRSSLRSCTSCSGL